MTWQVVHEVVASILLVVVLILVVVRPFKLDIAWFTSIGALIAIVSGLLPLTSLLTIFGATWDATITLIALFLLSQALDSSGFFNWSALFLARLARGSGWRLYGLMLLLTLAVVALLANDGAILMLTPIFARLLKKIYPREAHRLPFFFAAGLFADAMSIIFIPSNLTNIIIADANQLNFLRFAAWMLLPTLCAFIVGGGAFAWRFRQQISASYDVNVLEEPKSVIVDHVMFSISWWALGVLALGYIVGNEFHVPFSLVSGVIALAMLFLVQLRGLQSARVMLLKAPWNILIYALSMFVVITAAYEAQILGFLISPLTSAVHSGLSGALAAGGIVAILAAVVNNLPAVLVSVLALQKAAHVSQTAIYAIVIGTNIGPKLTPFGSLATLLWLGILKDHDINISWGTYMRENWWVVLLTLSAAFGGLCLSGLLFQ
jgi:arsenical pump membrane protein